jgi:hypothetical protein
MALEASRGGEADAETSIPRGTALEERAACMIMGMSLYIFQPPDLRATVRYSVFVLLSQGI